MSGYMFLVTWVIPFVSDLITSYELNRLGIESVEALF